MINLDKMIAEHPNLLQLVIPNQNIHLSRVSPPDRENSSSLVFVSSTQQMSNLSKSTESLWVISEKLWKEHKNLLTSAAQTQSCAVALCQNINVAMAIGLKYFDTRMELLSYPQGLSSLAWIDPSVKIGKNVTIGPFTTIGPSVEIGDNTIIGPHCTIEGGTRIGEKVYFESHVFIGRQCRIGDYCRIKPFASIGSDGYGYAPSSEGPLKIPQIGITVLENFVDVGSGSCIDRATMTETRIGLGTKIDNLVHIAHNCTVGRYCFITAGFAMAGSSHLGDHFMTGGTSAVADHVTIAPNVTLGGASVVTSNITEAGAYGGNPVQPMQDYLRTRSSVGQLPQLRRHVQKILKHLDLKD